MPHNGGRSQINVSFLYGKTEYLYCNLMKHCSIWGIVDNVTTYDITKHDTNGYMHTVYGSGVITRTYHPTQAARPGAYVLKWTGTGTMQFTGSASSSSGRITYTPASGALFADIKVTGVGTPGTDYPTNIIFCHIDDEALVDVNQYAFSPYTKTKYAKIGCIRWHDPQHTNDANSTVKWAHRMPETHYTYYAGRFDPAIYAGVSTNVGDAYTVACPSGWVFEDKAVIHVKWNIDCVGTTPTLTVTGQCTNIGMRDHNQLAFPFGENRKPKVGRIATLIYDSELGYFTMLGGNFSYYDWGLTGGMPIEHIVRYCNDIGCHAWLCIPHWALDPLSDLVTETINYVKNNLATGLMAKYEVSNEVWNNSAFYSQTSYADAKELAKYPAGSPNDRHNWYGRALAKLGKAVHDAYLGDTSRYDVICAMQAYGGVNWGLNRMNSANYVSEGGWPAKNYVTKGSCANYWHSSYAGTATETSMATEYATATAARKTELINDYVTSTAGTNLYTLEGSKVVLLQWSDYFKTFGRAIEPYEGGYDSGWQGTAGTVLTFTKACYAAPLVYDRTLVLYRYILTIGGAFPSQYNAVGDTDFSTHHPDIYGTPEPAWEAIAHFSTVMAGSPYGLRFRM